MLSASTLDPVLAGAPLSDLLTGASTALLALAGGLFAGYVLTFCTVVLRAHLRQEDRGHPDPGALVPQLLPLGAPSAEPSALERVTVMRDAA